jgi:hypothetical protein
VLLPGKQTAVQKAMLQSKGVRACCTCWSSHTDNKCVQGCLCTRQLNCHANDWLASHLMNWSQSSNGQVAVGRCQLESSAVISTSMCRLFRTPMGNIINQNTDTHTSGVGLQ